MHEYRDALIAREMRTLVPKVSEIDQHFASLIAGELPENGNMQRILVLGAHDTLIPTVLGGRKFNYVVFALVVRSVYMERQWQYAMRGRTRYDGQCLVRPIQSPYKAMVEFGDYEFRYVVVLPGAEFGLVNDYCMNHLHEEGIMIVIQNWPCEIGIEGLTEIWRKYLKRTEAGYCIGAEEEKAEWVVMSLKKIQ